MASIFKPIASPCLRLLVTLAVALAGSAVSSEPAHDLEIPRLKYVAAPVSRLPDKPLSHPAKTSVELNRGGEEIFKKPSAPLYFVVGFLTLDQDEKLREFILSDDIKDDHRFSNVYSQFGEGKNILALAMVLQSGSKRERDTGRMLLAAGANGLLWTYLTKSLTGRQRPNSADQPGKWHGPARVKNDSFPSGHTIGAVTAAVVLGHQYPVAKLLFYHLAALTGAARIKGRMHYPSDVYWGAGVGYYSAWQAIRNKEVIVRWSF